MNKKEAIKYLKQLYPNGGHCWLDEQRMEAIGMAVKALQEEPVKDSFAFKAIPRLLEMIEPTDKAKSYVTKLADAFDSGGYYTDAKIVRNRLKIMNDEKVPMATMDEEPVSEELENAAFDYAEACKCDGGEKLLCVEHFKAGAKWKAEQFEKERLKQCDTLTKEQAQIESDFVVNFIKKNNRIPTFIDAIEYGIKLKLKDKK